MKKPVTVLLAAFALQGCSGGSPSQSEIEEAITTSVSAAMLEKCERISIENVKKANGIKQDESHYQIVATYDVRIDPVGHKDEVEALRAEQEQFEQQMREVDEEMRNVGRAEGDSYPNPTWLRMHPEAASAQMRPLIDLYSELRIQKDEIDQKVHEKVKEIKAEWGSDYCYLIIGAGLGTGLFGFEDQLDTIMAGGANSFELTLDMIKTDNGWMLAR